MTSAISSVQPATASADQAKLKKAAVQFEAVFLRQMIGAMRASSMGDGIMDSTATQQFRDMSDAKLADDMASEGALHIADMLVKQFGARMAAEGKAADGATPK